LGCLRLNDPSIIFDDLIAAAHRVHAHASEIEAAAKPRMAYGYNAAQAARRGGQGRSIRKEQTLETTTFNDAADKVFHGIW
jgi:hypothetical protein